ncbi:uncharacterized protein LOC131212731 [Anopheles bellator]|uniref:uncharacterized protein LOC131212731 n=1 Tax=Anopheles bellator TaxID=139047 RepID=UPI002647063E|nr:uncharacterized protein LOC131212731 [Anopheles bellator]
MSKRNVWTGEETMELLEIIKEKNLMQVFVANRHRKDIDLYKQIENEMKKNGFLDKDANQIYHKWKNLKRSFFVSKKVNKGRACCEFSDELKEILEKKYVTPQEIEEQARENLILEDGTPAPVKKRRGRASKTIRSQIMNKLAKTHKDNSEEFSKKWNDLYDYEFKLYKRKDKEQTVALNAMLEANRDSLIRRYRSLFDAPILQVDQAETESANVVEVETTNTDRVDSTAKEFYQSLKFV